jgi:hypothetical protein
MHHYNWKQGILLVSTGSVFVKQAPWLTRLLQEHDIFIPTPVLVEPGHNSEATTAAEIKRTGIRIIILMGQDREVQEVAQSAQHAHLNGPGWCWIIVEETVGVKAMQGWLSARPVRPTKGIKAFAK